MLGSFSRLATGRVLCLNNPEIINKIKARYILKQNKKIKNKIYMLSNEPAIIK